MDAYDRSSAIEQATMTRIAEIYAGALRQALKKKKAFLQKVKDVDSGKIKPPKYYVQRGEVDKWKEGFLRELLRQEAVIDGIMEELDKAGVEAAELIRGSMVDIYRANREEAVDVIAQEADGMVLTSSFAQYDRNQVRVLIEEGQSPFSKVAYQNLGQNQVIRRRLQNELGMSTILGESQQQIIGRIRKITGQTVAQARRVAQTERTRVQSQARWQTGQEAAGMGVEIENTWSARMVNTRESHAALDGEKKPQGEAFHTIWGNNLQFPGDPEAPASEVINCHCVLVPHVVTKKRNRLPDTLESGIIEQGQREISSLSISQSYVDALRTGGKVTNIGGTNCVVSTQNHGFTDGNNGVKKNVAAIVYTLQDGTQFVFPKRYNRKLQTLTPEDAIRTWLRVPENVRGKIQKVIEIVDYYNPQEDYWRKKYKNFSHSYAVGGDKITFFRSSYHDMGYLALTYCHEGGHYIDYTLPGTSRSDPYSSQTQWQLAMSRDLLTSGRKSWRAYGENSPAEDFADSIAYYTFEHDKFAQLFPERTKLLDVILK